MNGTRMGLDYKLGSMVTFNCEAGYLLQGYSTLTCVMGSSKRPEWDRAKPSCQGERQRFYVNRMACEAENCTPAVWSIFDMVWYHDCVKQLLQNSPSWEWRILNYGHYMFFHGFATAILGNLIDSSYWEKSVCMCVSVFRKMEKMYIDR